MPISCEIDADSGVIYTTIVGAASTDEVIRTLKDTMTRPEFRPGLNGLVDLRASSYAPKSDEVRSIAQILINHHADIGHSRSALVVSTDLGYGLARMYQAMADESFIETQIFRSMEEARDWLGVE